MNIQLMRKNRVHPDDFQPKKPQISYIEISREDYDLLDVEQNVIYHIFEADGSITVRKGVNI